MFPNTSHPTMQKQKFSEVVKRIWKIGSPYWLYSKERWGSLILLAVNIFVMVFQTRVGVRMTIWNRDWINAFQSYDAQMWKQQIAVFLLVGAASTFTSSLNTYIQSWIQLRWRRWMTARYINYWLTGSAHYRMQLTGNETDNPDQRIAEDISMYIGSTWTYSFSFVQNCISLVTYAVMLYDLSLTIPLWLFGKDWSFDAPSWCISICMLCYLMFYFILYRVKNERHACYVFFGTALLGTTIILSGVNYPLWNELVGRGIACFSMGASAGCSVSAVPGSHAAGMAAGA